MRVYRTPDSILQRQLTAYDEATAKRKDNAIFREIEASQKAFAQRAVRFNLDYNVSPRMAYNHYFGKPAAKPAAKKKA